MATQPIPSPSDETIEKLLVSTIFDPEAVLKDCDDYLNGQTDLLKRANAHYVKFRAHSELFRNAQTASLGAQPRAEHAHQAPHHKGQAELFYNEAAQFYKTDCTKAPLPRNVLAHYDVEELIGVGEFAYVFRTGITAGKTRISTIALKVFKQPFDIAQPAVEAFAATLEKLKQNADELPKTVVRVLSVDTEDPKQPYYTMAEIKGSRLDHWLTGFHQLSYPHTDNDASAKRPTAAPGAEEMVGTHTKQKEAAAADKTANSLFEVLQHSSLVNIIRQIAVALDAVHGLGVVHLDLKPSNVLIKDTGRVDGNGSVIYYSYLTDFGFLYLQLAGLPLRGISALSDVLNYLAPEIVRDPHLGIDNNLAKYAQSDIYAFGRLGLYLFSGRLDQEMDAQVDALALFDPRLAVLLVRCSRARLDERPKDFAEVIERLKTVQLDIDKRCTQAKELSADDSMPPFRKWLLHIVRVFSVSPGDIVLALDDSRQFEAKLGALAPFILFGYALKPLLVSHPTLMLSANIAYLPCFLAATTCTLIGYLYFKYITCRCQYYRSPLREMIRAAQCFLYGIPIIIGITWPQWWPFCTAAGYLGVAINNHMMFGYMEQHTREEHLPYLFRSNRRHMTEVLHGYVGSGVCGVLGLLIAGGVLVWFRAANISSPGAYGFELACGLLVAVVNFILIKTAVVGEPGDRIARTLAQEYAIRDQVSVPRRKGIIPKEVK